MFWLIKKVFGIGIFAALVFFALQFQVGGRPIKDYVVRFYQSPLIQEAIRQTTTAVKSYLQKDVTSSKPGDPNVNAPAMDPLPDEDRRELENVLKKEARHPKGTTSR